MKRISLDARLDQRHVNRIIVDLLARLPVDEYLCAVASGKSSVTKAFIQLAEQMKGAGLAIDPMMCNTVVAIARSGDPNTDAMLYGLLVEPVYRVKKEREKAHDHAVHNQRDSHGLEQDHDGGRGVPVP